MNIFDTQKSIVQDYLDHIRSFLNIKNDRIREVVEQGQSSKKLCPDPRIQFKVQKISDKKKPFTNKPTKTF